MIRYFMLVLFIMLVANKKRFKEVVHYIIVTPRGYNNLKKRISAYGYNYEMKQHIMMIVVSCGALYILCELFKVNIDATISLMIIWLLMVPFLVLWVAYHSYQETMFNEFTLFLQHFIAFYKLTPKVYYALSETRRMVDVQLQTLIDQMLEKMDEGVGLKETLQLLIDYEPHFIVHNLVSLVTTIEEHGSNEYSEGLDLIGDDIDDWIEDVYTFENARLKIKNKILLLCAFSFLIGFIAKNMLNQISFDNSGNIYQCTIFIYFVCILFTLMMAHNVLKESWFDKEEQL
ncbi:MAG: hypothetical protein RR929_02655 [Erysipelotrichaceae bacterium]